MERFMPPELLHFKEKITEEWQKWKEELTLYLTTTEEVKKSKQEKSSTLLTCIDEKGNKI